MKRIVILIQGVACAGTLAFVPAAYPQGVLHAFTGDSAGAFLGSAVAGAGDVDQDGFDDLLLGAPFDTAGGVACGSARVLSGREGSLLFMFHGNGAGAVFGRSVAAAGDVDNDGTPDLVIGAPQYWGVPNARGYAVVRSGTSGLLLHTFAGDSNYDWFGAAVDGAGDVDGDGFADVVVGAPMDDNTGVDSGMTRVLSGKTGAILHAKNGDGLGDQLGHAVAGAVDVDQDGRSDFAAGAPYDDDQGQNSGLVRVWSGATGAALHTLHGQAAAERFGFALDGAGDVDEDGHADLLVGAPYASALDFEAGSARVHSGKTGAGLHDLMCPVPTARFGKSLASAGDVDRDGVPDLVIGAEGDDTAGPEAGSASVHSGKTGALIFTAHGGPQPVLYYGSAVAGAGDVNDDGFADVVIGDPHHQFQAGGARVLSGTCGPIVHYGNACPGSGGFAPQLVLSGCATPAGTIHLRLVNGLGGTNALLVFGVQPTDQPIAGACHLYVNPVLPFIPGFLPLQGSGSGQGVLDITFDLPPQPAALDVTIQALCVDPGAPFGFTATNGVAMRVQ